MAQGFLLTAAVIAVAATGYWGRRYRVGRALSDPWWSASFLLLALVALAEAASVGGHWSALTYPAYIVSSGAVAGTLATGMAYWAFPRPVGHGLAVVVSALAVGLLAEILVAPPAIQGSWLALSNGATLHGVTRWTHLILSELGGWVVIVGAAWGAWRRRRPLILLVLVGIVAQGLGDSLPASQNPPTLLAALTALGIALMALGALYGGMPGKRDGSPAQTAAR